MSIEQGLFSYRKASLSYKDQQSDKVYEVEIVYLAWEQYHVNYAYGRTGTKLRQGTKTKNPVSRQEAEKIYHDLVASKQKKGYRMNPYFPQSDSYLLPGHSLQERQAIIDRLKQENTENLLEELKKLGFERGNDLMGLDLSNTDLSNADLRGCDLVETNLCGANLRGARLQGTNLGDSQIDETTQLDPKWRLIVELVKDGGENRDLRGVDLSNIWLNFDDLINLTGANLEGVNLSNSRLYNFEFSNANLKNANLSKSELGYLSGACLEGADLSDAELGELFNNVICVNTNFSRVNCNDEHINFENANCTGANFQEASLTSGLISGADFTNANFTGVIGFDRFISGIEGSEITKEVSFKNADLSRIDIADFDYLTEIYGIELINWQGARFDHSNFQNTYLSGLTFKDVSFRNVNFQGAKLENCNFEGADFTGANLADANLKGVNLSQVLSFKDIIINENTQVDEQWQDWLNEHQQNQSLPATREQPIPTEPIDLQKVTIKTPKVNKEGKIIKTESYEIEYFTEILPNGVELEMIYLVGGTFEMGVYYEYQYRHQVTVPSFYMAKYPITQEQWKAIAQLDTINRELILEPSYFQGDKRPVESISWRDAVEFCQRLSRLTNKTYQLPSEAQWEYACRAGTSTHFCFGETITKELANYYSYLEETTVVGTFPPNGFGLYDMHGNVWEWCLDDWRCNYGAGKVTDGSAFMASRIYTEQKALRGGCFYSRTCPDLRAPAYPTIVRQSYGFRVQVQ
ncbi:MAG: pentapeptide repeat-containing protein [Microcystaceae cyanobacterium]